MRGNLSTIMSNMTYFSDLICLIETVTAYMNDGGEILVIKPFTFSLILVYVVKILWIENMKKINHRCIYVSYYLLTRSKNQ